MYVLAGRGQVDVVCCNFILLLEGTRHYYGHVYAEVVFARVISAWSQRG